jgi:membrane protease YdiL (CAAX protease family)
VRRGIGNDRGRTTVVIRRTSRRRPARTALLYAGGLLAVGNAKTLVLPASLAGSGLGVGAGIGISGTSLLYARWAGLTPADLGLAEWRRRAPTSLLVGVGTGVGLALLAAALARTLTGLGLAVPLPTPPADLARLSRAALRRRLLAYLLLDTAIPEEIVCRGVIYAELERRTGSRLWTMLGTTGFFVLWHLALGLREVLDLSPRPGSHFGPLAEKFGAYAFGSLAFSVPRVVAGQLSGCVAVHWLVDALLMVGGHPAGRALRAHLLGA